MAPHSIHQQDIVHHAERQNIVTHLSETGSAAEHSDFDCLRLSFFCSRRYSRVQLSEAKLPILISASRQHHSNGTGVPSATGLAQDCSCRPAFVIMVQKELVPTVVNWWRIAPLATCRRRIELQMTQSQASQAQGPNTGCLRVCRTKPEEAVFQIK